MANLPDPNMPIIILIGAIGKALVKKGLLNQAEIVAELNDIKSGIDPKNPHAAGLVAEVDNMIATVGKW